MAGSTKRERERQLARTKRLHEQPLPEAKMQEEEQHKASARKGSVQGIARYPWATVIILCLVVVAIIAGMATVHAGPFATKQATPTPKATPKATATATAAPTTTATSTASSANAGQTTADTSSPCVSKDILSAITDTAAAPTSAQIKEIKHTYSGAQNVTDTSKVYCAGINTTKGLIVLELDPKIAPKTVNNFVFLAENHFYDGLTFHRVEKDFVAQGGDPEGTGSGGPGYKFADETVQGNYTEGTVAMANSGANTNGSQFFINLADNSQKLTKSYNLFGHVVQGMDAAEKLTVTENGSAKPDVMNHVIVKAAS